MSVLGTRVLRTEDPAFLTVGGRYTADLDDPRLDGALYVTFVRSLVAHGRISSIDTDEARAAPGVVAVFTAEDLGDLPTLPLNPPVYDPGFGRPALARDRVRFVGEPYAVIVSETPTAGADAAELVWADIDFLDPVLTPDDADTGPALFDDLPNVCMAFSHGAPDDTADETADDLFGACDVVVAAELLNQRVAGCPLEVRAAAANWVDDRLVLFVSTQSPHAVRDALAAWYGLDEADVHVIAPDVGGGFGPKIGTDAEQMLLGWVSRQVGRPVRWLETRSENMVGMGHGRGQWQTVTIGGDRDGNVQAYRLDVTADAGAYPALGGFLPFMTRTMLTGVYDIPATRFESRSIVTNTTPTVAYRGAGRPEATAAIERAMDLFAAEIDLDPAEVRRRNLVPADAFPYTTPTGTVYDCGDYEGALDRVLAAAGYDELRAEQAERRAAGDVVQVGIGVSAYVEVTAGPAPGGEFGRMEVHSDGTATVFTGSSSHGQGHATAFAMLASSRTGIPVDDITVVHGDTDRVARGVGTFGSRSLQLGGSAVHGAAGAVVEAAQSRLARRLSTEAGDLVLDVEAGGFHTRDEPDTVISWSDVAGAEGIHAEVDFNASQPTFPFGAHVAVVDVDTETGLVRLRRLISCDDAGTILNPMLVEGQRHGGIAQGVAQALYEQVSYDEDGNPVTSNLADYTMISAAELPDFELVDMETPTPVNPLGAKGIGESGTIGSTPAVQSAVVDALAPYGIRHLDMPCTPQAVWDALRKVSDTIRNGDRAEENAAS